MNSLHLCMQQQGDLIKLKEATNKILEDIELHILEKNRALFVIFGLIIEESTSQEKITFTSLFSRISYLNSTQPIPTALLKACHNYRRIFERGENVNKNQEELFQFASTLITTLFSFLTIKNLIINDQTNSELKRYAQDSQLKIGFKPLIEGLLTSINLSAKTIEFIPNDSTDLPYSISYDVPHVNEIFTKNLQSIPNIYQLPIHLNLIDVNILKENTLEPKAFVLCPDYLVNVTTIANAYKDAGGNAWMYALSKYKEKLSSPAIMTGNVANYLLDILVGDQNINLNTKYSEIFSLDPLTWTNFNDREIKEIFSKIHTHFENLKRVLNTDLTSHDIDLRKTYLEPTFYSRTYGIQGRLDLFHYNSDTKKADIIELKSGKIYKPNAYGINHTHYTQALLYDAMISTSFKSKISVKNFILYSSKSNDNLKFAPSIKPQLYEALRVRNEIVSIEHALSNKDSLMTSKIFNHLKESNFPDSKGFIRNDLVSFENTYQNLNETEKAYFEEFSSFIAREQILAKKGEHGLNKSNGLSGLWLEPLEEKIDRFSIFNHLHLIKNESDANESILTFKKTEYSSKLANFRIGDIAVLYPHQHNPRHILNHQIFKCTILGFNDDQISIRLRHPQRNQEVFQSTEFWNIEEDYLDGSFTNMYRSLYNFAESSQKIRRLILGQEGPKINSIETHTFDDKTLTTEQKNILNKIISSENYFLLWGPPGTGKTSVVIKNIARYLYKYSTENILFLAYTNRAVDEICLALNQAGLEGKYIRIGSRYSVGEQFRPALLENNSKTCKSRSEIVETLRSKKVYVSTISSMLGKKQLFKIIPFHTAIIDEASQILEPMIVGLLTFFQRFIMIGDHKQLPAVVTQKQSLKNIESDLLISAGITDTGMSFFERLLNKCTQEGWHHSYGILRHQGRMHEEIMRFNSDNFYNGKLKALPNISRLHRPLPNNGHNIKYLSHRMVFFNTKTDVDFNWKTNKHEAKMVAKILSDLTTSIEDENIDIGVITPYRAQIALLKSTIDKNILEKITVDTVERYQGGARNIIIISLCTNKLNQLESLVSLSQDGIDRKLNVALTRAREQVIILGNREILETNSTYQKLITYCYVVENDI